jgi:uncharacterized protein (DUF4415 family)
MATDPAAKTSSLPPDFQQAADPVSAIIEPPRVMVSLPLDADLVAYFQNDAEPSDWQQHINGVLRFYRDSNLAMEADAEFAAQIGQHHDAPKP